MNTSRSLLVSFVAVTLAMLSGCSASAPKPAASASMDATWMPSEAVDVAIRDTGTAPVRGKEQNKGAYRPNRESIPQHGAVHAALR